MNSKSKTRSSSKRRAPKTDAAASKRARADKRKGKAPYTQAGEFVHEEMEAYKGKSSRMKPKNRKQAIAIGLSKARKHGIHIPNRKAS